MNKNPDGFVISAGSEEMRQTHALQLNMLLQIDAICRESGISYFLLFGTLLGAVRHGGFIPWDDDIDIGVMRCDYDRLLDLMEEKLDSEYFFVQTAGNDAGIAITHAKLRCHKTCFEELVSPPSASFHQGIFLDIFPLDVVPDDPVAAKQMKRRFLSYQMAYRYKVEGYRSDRLHYNIVYRFFALNSIPRLLYKRYCAMTAYADNQDTERLIAFAASPAEYDSSFLMRMEMEPPSTVSFCGFDVMAPQQAKVQLHSLFGDYMKLPPEKQRKGHLLRHFSIDQKFWQSVLDTYLPYVDQHSESGA